MAEYPPAFGSMTVNIEAQTETAPRRLQDEMPCRMLILGDFSGRANRGLAAPGAAIQQLRPRRVDRDNLEELPGKLGASLALPPLAGDEPLRIDFEEVEDFHPDQLYDRLEIFQHLRQLRRSLHNPATFATAAAEVRELLGMSPQAATSHPRPATPSPPPAAAPGAGSLLDAIIDEAGAVGQDRTPGPDEPLQQFLQTVVAPHLLPTNEADEEAMVAAVDGLIAALMRAILHHPDVQALEAAWRGLQLLLSRLSSDEELEIYLLDWSQEEWAADLLSSDLLEKTALSNLLITPTQHMGAIPWALVAGVYSFTGSDVEAEVLGRMAQICACAAVPFVAAAAPLLVGCPTSADLGHHLNEQKHLVLGQGNLWPALRALPEAVWLGLLLPRLLLRLPYGSKTNSLDRFAFEEQESNWQHEQYLWGNPIFACCCLLGRNFLRQGRFQPTQILEIDDLPLHVVTTGGERSTLPCAEFLLTLKGAETLLESGLMPLLSFKDQDRIRLARVQSIATPLASLADGWTVKG